MALSKEEKNCLISSMKIKANCIPVQYIGYVIFRIIFSKNTLCIYIEIQGEICPQKRALRKR
jgi:hypothetical protein